MITIEQLKSIKERTEALYRYLDIEGKKIQVEEEQLRTQAPGFWDDQKTAEAQMKKVKGLQQWIAGYNEIKTLSDELQLAFEFYKDELVTEEEIDEACHIACVDEFLDRLPAGYESEMGQGGVNVSGGQKQRICIARAILKKPKVLILDDSTSAVDTATEGRIREELAKKLPDMTKLVIAQRISSVKHADQIIILDKGCVNAIGTHEELLRTNKIYQEIYESQKEGADL